MNQYADEAILITYWFVELCSNKTIHVSKYELRVTADKEQQQL